MKKSLLVVIVIIMMPCFAFAADTKGSDLSAPGGGPARTDKVYIIDDPGGTPASAADTIANVLGLIADADVPPTLTIETVSGTPVVTNGVRIGTDDTDHLIDEASNGSGSATIYIGNESILASGDIGVSVQGYNANTTILGSTIGAAEVDADVATQAELDAVAALVDTDDEIIAIINASPSTQIVHEAGGLEADVSAYAGLVAISGGSTSNVTDAAGLETTLSLGAYASDILGAADSDALVTLLGLVAGDIPDLSATYEVQLNNEAGLYAALSDVSDFVQPAEAALLVDECKDQTFQTFGSSDATPDVSNGGTGVHPCWQVHQSTSPTITDFDDGDDHSEFAAGYKFLLLVNYTATIDFSDNSNIEGNSNVDFTGSSSQIMYLLFQFDGTRWIEHSLPGKSSPNVLSISGIAVTTLEASELNDTSDPHLLTATELKSHYISNYESVGADEWDFPARTEGWDFCFVKEVDQNVTLDPNGTEQWQFRTDNSGFTQLSAGEAIVNTTAGESAVCCFSTETAVYCTGDANWAEETP